MRSNLKTFILFLIIPCCLSVACSNNKKETAQPDEIIIEGHIEGLKDGTIILLGEHDVREASGRLPFIDTVKNERFQFSIIDTSLQTKTYLLIALIDNQQSTIFNT